MRRATSALALLAAVALVAACRGNEPTAPTGPAVVNTTLGIAIATVPDSLRVTANEGRTLTLAPVTEGAGGQIWFAVQEPAVGGVNLLEAVHAHQAKVESKPGGAYLGARELVTPLGPAYWSRGRWEQEGVNVEEVRIFALHPDGRRMLVGAYLYPAGEDSPQRVRELLDLFGEVEGTPRDLTP